MPPRLNRILATQRAGESDRPDSGALPVRVLQVGTGVFLRAFSGWMVERMNRRGLFGGSIVVAQATPSSRTRAVINEQGGCYTVLQRGLQDGRIFDEAELVTCVRGAIDPYSEWAAFLTLAENPDLRFVISNTTEAGIADVDEPRPTDTCPASFPAQLTALLHRRFEYCGGAAQRGLFVLPCELIDHNGERLREIVLRRALAWGLGDRFQHWVSTSCRFLNTLVDRIVTGFPGNEAEALGQRLGYDDRLLVACEPYHSWIIEADEQVARELPLVKAGMNVVWTSDVERYRKRKVRILNGAHSLMTPVAFLVGKETVRESIEDPLIRQFLEGALFNEILPSLDLPANDTDAFARTVLERFANPFVRHQLLNIALNATSKWKVRVLPSLMAAARASGTVPRRLVFSLAALIAFCRPRHERGQAVFAQRDGQEYELRDTSEAFALLRRAWTLYDREGRAIELSRTVLAQQELWGLDLNAIAGLTAQVGGDLESILREGMRPAIARTL